MQLGAYPPPGAIVTPLVVAHRGASNAERENTIAAFVRARQMGAEMVELDVRRTADGALVVHHDPVVDGRVIVDCLRADLPLHVPDLDAALDACAGMQVNIEIKSDPSEPDYDATQSVASAVVALLADRSDRAQILISSFDRDTINRVRELDPTLRTGFLFTFPTSPADELCAALAAEGHVAIHPHRKAALPILIDAAHAHRLAVNVWTVDDPDEMRLLAERGVDAIITNLPDLARRIL